MGISSVVAILAVGDGARDEILRHIQRLGIGTVVIRQVTLTEQQQQEALPEGIRGLTIEDVVHLKALIKPLRYVVPVKVVTTAVTGLDVTDAVEVIATTTEYAWLKGLTVEKGRFLSDLDSLCKQAICVLGRGLIPGSVPPQTICLGGIPFRVIGVLQSLSQDDEVRVGPLKERDLDRSLFIPFGLHALIEGQEEAALDEIWMQWNEQTPPQLYTPLIRSVLRLTHRKGYDYQVIVPAELIAQTDLAKRTFRFAIGVMAIICLLVGGIGITNVMLMTVTERMGEIGIRRAVGASRTHIAIQFLFESTCITVFGGSLGLLGGILFSCGLSLAVGWNVRFHVLSAFIAFLLAVLVGLAAGLYPAWRACQVSCLEAIRKD